MGRMADIALWISRRLRFAVMALIAVGALKTAASALDDPSPQARISTPIAPLEADVSP